MSGSKSSFAATLGRRRAGRFSQRSSTYETVRKFGESLGCKPVNVVACFGEYDFVGLWDCPNEVAALKLAACAVSNGTVKIQTLPACKIQWPKKIDRSAVEELCALDFVAEIANVVLIGPNSTGKTTIAKNLAHLSNR